MVTVITGLVLVGKSTLVKRLMQWGYKPVIEYTTRPMRKGEKNHKDYHFVDDDTFDKMDASGEFAETLCVETIYGLWKYGAKKEDLKDGYVLACGPTQIAQLIDSGVSCLTVLLDISRDSAMKRAIGRGDNMEEFNRRFIKDTTAVNKIRNKVDMVLDADNTIEVNARAVDNRISLERKKAGICVKSDSGYEYRIGNEKVITAQKMNEYELNLYLAGDRGLKPYLRMKERGMPHNPVNQIAWLLLQGGSCGFCKVCREKPCNIADNETCTNNIANYIRECVHAEDAKKNKEVKNE